MMNLMPFFMLFWRQRSTQHAALRYYFLAPLPLLPPLPAVSLMATAPMLVPPL